MPLVPPIKENDWPSVRRAIQGLSKKLGYTASPEFAGLTISSLTLVNPITEFSTDGTFSGNSDVAVPTEKAAKTYVDAVAAAAHTFKTITGITNDVVADTAADTLTLASANARLTIVGTAVSDTITFTADTNLHNYSWTSVDGTDLKTGSVTQAYGAVLDDFNTLGIAASDGQFIVATGEGVFNYESTTTARTSLGVGESDTPTFARQTLTDTCLVAGGANFLRVTGLQTDGTAMTGTLRGAYIDVSNGNTAATGTIRGMELKARTEAPGDTGNNVNVLEGLSISADSKDHSVTTMRAAEFILDGSTGGTITEAVGLRIANNFQANKATASYGLQIYRDSFDYTYDVTLSKGGHITGDSFMTQDYRTTGYPVFINTNTALSSMVMTGGAISAGTNAGTIKVAALTAMLRTGAGATDPLTKITLAEQDNITLAANDTYYNVLLTYGDPCTIATSADDGNGANIIGIGHCLKETDGTRHYADAGLRLADGVRRLHNRASRLRRIEKSSGALVSETGTRNLYVTAGTFHRGINNYDFTLKDTSDEDTFDYYYYNPDGSVWVKDDNEGSHYTQIGVTQYNKVDTGTGLANLVANKYTTNWVFVHPDDEHIIVVYGRSNSTLTAAENENIPPSLPDIVDKLAVLLCKIIVRATTGTLVFENVEFFTFTPDITVDHNELQALQGGTVDEYYHLTSAEHTLISAVGALTPTDSNFIVGNDTTWVAESGATVRTSLGLGTGDSPTFTALTLSTIAAEGTDVDKFLVDSTGIIKYRTGTQVLSDIGASATSHLHNAATLQHDAVNSDGGAFSFTTTGTVTFNQSIATANYTAANLLTACATSAGGLDFSGAYTLTVGETATTTSYHTDTRAATWLGANHETTYTHTDIALNTTHRGTESGNPHSVTPTELSLVIGTNTQAHGDVLDDLNTLGIVGANSEFLVGTAEGALAWENAATAKASIGLGNVENTKLSTWVGSANITTLGTIATVGNITIADGNHIGQSDGPLITFDNTTNYLEITGCNVGIGITTPEQELHLAASEDNCRMAIDTYDNGAMTSSIQFRKSRSDTIGTTTASEDGDIIGSFDFVGCDTNSTWGGAANIKVIQNGNAGTTKVPADMYFLTSPGGTTAPVERFKIGKDGGIHAISMKSGTDQANAGAATGELYSDTNDDNTVKIGV